MRTAVLALRHHLTPLPHSHMPIPRAVPFPHQLKSIVDIGAAACAVHIEAQSCPLLLQLGLHAASASNAVDAVLCFHEAAHFRSMEEVGRGLGLNDQEMGLYARTLIPYFCFSYNDSKTRCGPRCSC